MTNPFASATAASNANISTPMATVADKDDAPETPKPAGNLSDLFSTDVSSGDMAKLKTDLGAAVVVRPTEWIESMKTVNGETSAIRADWIVLDGPNQGAVRSNSLVFNTVVRNTMRNVLEGPYPFFVGVVAEGPAKPGKNSPLIFEVANDDQLKLAEQAVTAHGWA